MNLPTLINIGEIVIKRSFMHVMQGK